MSSIGGGRRNVEDERRLLTELGRLFHIAKANSKETHPKSTTETSAAAATAKNTKSSQQQKTKKGAARRVKEDSRRGSQRRSKQGGSIWIVLKGGFASKTVPLSTDMARIQSRADARAQRSEQRRIEALEMAEAYVKSAWANAQEANLVVKDPASGELLPTTEGESYMREQYAVAARMLRPAPAGAPLQSVVQQATAARASSSSLLALKPYDNAISKSAWESIVPRELAILNYGGRAGSDGADRVAADVANATKGYHFPLAEPAADVATTTTTEGPAGDVVPTKCIIRISSSQRQRHTAILSSAKAVNHFTTNFPSLLRKELSSSKLPRGAEETLDGETGTSASGATQPQRKTAQSQSQSAKSAGRGKGGKNKKK